MTSPRRSQERPIESVELKISIRADRETSRKIKEAIPSAVTKGGACEVKITAQRPADVMEAAKVVLEKLRAIERPQAGP